MLAAQALLLNSLPPCLATPLLQELPFGQSLKLVGSHPALGECVAAMALSLSCQSRQRLTPPVCRMLASLQGARSGASSPDLCALWILCCAGDWAEAKGQRMTWGDGHVWTADVPLAPGTALEFKVCRKGVYLDGCLMRRPCLLSGPALCCAEAVAMPHVPPLASPLAAPATT